MKLLAEAGTDVASVALFDPDALPEDFDERPGEDTWPIIEQLAREGRVHEFNTGSDGGFLLHVYLDEPVPDALAKYVREPITVEKFLVPSGRLYFAGSEYIFRRDDSPLRKHPSLGTRLDIRPGTYKLTFSWMDYPHDSVEEKMKAAVGRRAAALHEAHGCIMAVSVLVVLFAVLDLVASVWYDVLWNWFRISLPAATVAILVPLLFSLLPGYRRAVRTYRALEKEHPCFVAFLETLDA